MSLKSIPLSDINSTQLSGITTVLISLGMPSELSSLYTEYFQDLQVMNYHTIEMEEDDITTRIVPALAIQSFNYLVDYLSILKKFKNEAGLLLDVLPSEKETLAHGHTITKSESKRNMSEDAPITSNASSGSTPNYNIDTPSERFNADNSGSDTHSGTDTTTKNNPYYWETYSRLIEKYNIDKIIFNSVKYITKEYNSVN